MLYDLNLEKFFSSYDEGEKIYKNYIQTDLKMVLIPGVAIFVTAAVFNLFGEKLRDRVR